MNKKGFSQLRVAIIHFWLTGMRGGERIVESLCRLFPQADIYTHVVRREVTLGELYGRDRVVVDSGVEPGERVVTAGVYQLRQGERVRILK